MPVNLAGRCSDAGNPGLRRCSRAWGSWCGCLVSHDDAECPGGNLREEPAWLVPEAGLPPSVPLSRVPHHAYRRSTHRTFAEFVRRLRQRHVGPRNICRLVDARRSSTRQALGANMDSTGGGIENPFCRHSQCIRFYFILYLVLIVSFDLSFDTDTHGTHRGQFPKVTTS